MSKTNASVREDVASGVVRTAIDHRVAHALDQEEHRLAELIVVSGTAIRHCAEPPSGLAEHNR